MPVLDGNTETTISYSGTDILSFHCINSKILRVGCNELALLQILDKVRMKETTLQGQHCKDGLHVTSYKN